MFNKKVGMLALVAGTGLMALAGCGPTGPVYDLTIYCPEQDNEVMATIIEKFKEAHPEYADLNIAVTANGGEGDIGNALQTDYKSQPDVVMIADDNLRTAAEASAILPIGTDREAAVLEQAGQSGLDAVSLETATAEMQAYGIPFRNDNGYALIYDSTKITDEQAKTMEGIAEACVTNHVDFFYPLANGWYTPTFLWAAGGEFSAEVIDGKVILSSNFDTPEVAAGAEAMSELFGEYGIATSDGGDGIVASDDSASIQEGFADGTVGACVLWNALENIRTAVGEDRADDIKVTVLPSLKINGVDKQMKTFLGYKAVSVNANVINETINWKLEEGEEAPEITREDLAWDFAEYLTSTESQKTLLDVRGYGPADISLRDDEKVTSNEFLMALQTMELAGNTVPQGANVTPNFWTPMENFGALIRDNAGTDHPWGSEYTTAAEAIAGMITSTTGWATGD